METQKIEPHKVTKPIQLLAAWLVGLVLVNGAFLFAASGIEQPIWLKATLIIAAIVNVPLFLGAIFLLQTKFRPELQEDSYYSKYINKETSEVVIVSKYEEMLGILGEIRKDIASTSAGIATTDGGKLIANGTVIRNEWAIWGIALCDLLPDFERIRSELKELNIPVSRIFGRANTKSVPEVNVISFDRSVDFEIMLKLLRILSKYRFDGYLYSPSRANEEAIYIGGFGYMNGGYFPFNNELRKLISSDIELSDLKYFEDRNPRINPNKSLNEDAR